MKIKRTAAALAAVTLAAGFRPVPHEHALRMGWTTLVDGTKGMENFRPVGDAKWVASRRRHRGSPAARTPATW
jgi:hypothetical protein